MQTILSSFSKRRQLLSSQAYQFSYQTGSGLQSQLTKQIPISSLSFPFCFPQAQQSLNGKRLTFQNVYHQTKVKGSVAKKSPNRFAKNEKRINKQQDNNEEYENKFYQSKDVGFKQSTEEQSLIQKIQNSFLGEAKSKYFSIYDTFADQQIKDNVQFFKDFRKQYLINDVALFGYFKLREIKDLYKNEYKILSFMLEDKLIQRFREHFDKSVKFQKIFRNYFELPYNEKCDLVRDRFGPQNISFYLNFYPLFELFILFAGKNLEKRYSESVEICDRLNLEEPHSSYPEARKIKRKIIYHYGPTNSGKTHVALNTLMKAKSGIYCGPLRLLANEIYLKFKQNGISCNLHTGQEKIYEPDSKFYSCTTEIACQKINLQFDCAVIDEIQFLGDQERGGAWTKAFLGLQAKEIHLCGDGRVLQLVEDICVQTGDEFQTIRYERMSDLKVCEKVINVPKELEEGDCLICFSSHDAINYKQKVNAYMNNKNPDKKEENQISIIYGRQPAEVKKMQAELFNNRTHKYLVATNAIGLGLNLNIKRIIFTSFQKRTNSERREIDQNEILQISGRAGRYKEDGLVGVVHKSQLENLYQTLQLRDSLIQKQSIKKAAFFPAFEQIESFAQWLNEGQRKKKKLSEVFTKFVNYATCQGNYFIENEVDFCKKSDIIEDIGLSLKDQFIFSQAPMRMGKMFEKEREFFKVFAQKYALGQEILLPDLLRDEKKIQNVFEKSEKAQDLLTIYESLYYILELYVWLGNKFNEESFPDIHLAIKQKDVICEIMHQIHSKIQYD